MQLVNGKATLDQLGEIPQAHSSRFLITHAVHSIQERAEMLLNICEAFRLPRRC